VSRVMASRAPRAFPEPVHFIGIGGAGMSAIALVLHQLGVRVGGSDLKQSRYTRRLVEGDVPVTIGHHADNLGDAVVVVVSSAIPRGNPELRAARQRGVPVLQRAEMLARLMAMRRGISVAGTHGKTTTSSMVSHVLHGAGLDPTYVIGGELNEMASNAGLGQGEWLVAETDESDGSLVYLRPEIAAVMNLEMDHHANYTCLDEIREVFRTFVRLLPRDGLLVLVEGTGTEALREASAAPVTTVGLDGGDWRAQIERGDSFSSGFRVWRGEEELGLVRLRVGGAHNVIDALVCLVIVDRCGLAFDTAAAQLATFSGAARRFDEVGRPRGVLVYDDYAHHPTEIEATLKAARLGNHRKIIAVFQPHLYSRTRHLQREFGRALTLADETIVTDISGVREEPEPGVTGKLVVDAYLAERPGGPVHYLPRNADVVRFLRGRVRPGDLVLTLGAGDIYTVAAELVTLLSRDGEAVPGPAAGGAPTEARPA
jgi:UDP-N-acetylmuramate--alanine ligase